MHYLITVFAFVSGCTIPLGTSAPIVLCTPSAEGPAASFDFGHNPSPEEMAGLSALGLLGDGPSDGYVAIPDISFHGTRAFVVCPPDVTEVEFVRQ